MFFYYVFSAAMLLRRSPFVVASAVIGCLSLAGFFVSQHSAVARVCLSEQNLLFVVGMVLAHLHRKGFRLPRLAAVAVFLAGLALMLTGTGRALLFPVLRRFDIGAALVVLGALSFRVPGGYLFAALVRLGDSSFSLYLFHPIIAPAIALGLWKIGATSLLPIVVVSWAASIALGHLAFLFIEQPLTKAARWALRGS